MILTSTPVAAGLRGEITPPGDKSISHRALIFASLAAGRSRLSGLLESEDTHATLEACRQLGARLEPKDGQVIVEGTAGQLVRPPAGVLELGNSGTAMRLLAGVVSGQGVACELTGDASLNQRPMRRIIEPLTRMGAQIEASEDGTAPLFVRAGQGLRGIDYASPVSSAQVKSCVLLAGLFAGGVTRVTEPRPSRDHTERMLPLFGVDLPAPGTVRGGSTLRATDFSVPGDMSSAVFPLAAAALLPGSAIRLRGVGLNPTRAGFLRCLEAMGAALKIGLLKAPAAEPVADIELHYNGRLAALEVSPEQVPDMIDELPLLMVLAATAKGTTRIRGATELRVKESDRLAVMASGLSQLGVILREHPDGIDITGGPVCGGRVASARDHRCAMAFSLLGLIAAAAVQVDEADYIATSYPGFIKDMNRLGAKMDAGEPA